MDSAEANNIFNKYFRSKKKLYGIKQAFVSKDRRLLFRTVEDTDLSPEDFRTKVCSIRELNKSIYDQSELTGDDVWEMVWDIKYGTNRQATRNRKKTEKIKLGINSDTFLEKQVECTRDFPVPLNGATIHDYKRGYYMRRDEDTNATGCYLRNVPEEDLKLVVRLEPGDKICLKKNEAIFNPYVGPFQETEIIDFERGAIFYGPTIKDKITDNVFATNNLYASVKGEWVHITEERWKYVYVKRNPKCSREKLVLSQNKYELDRRTTAAICAQPPGSFDGKHVRVLAGKPIEQNSWSVFGDKDEDSIDPDYRPIDWLPYPAPPKKAFVSIFNPDIPRNGSLLKCFICRAEIERLDDDFYYPCNGIAFLDHEREKAKINQNRRGGRGEKDDGVKPLIPLSKGKAMKEHADNNHPDMPFHYFVKFEYARDSKDINSKQLIQKALYSSFCDNGLDVDLFVRTRETRTDNVLKRSLTFLLAYAAGICKDEGRLLFKRDVIYNWVPVCTPDELKNKDIRKYKSTAQKLCVTYAIKMINAISEKMQAFDFVDYTDRCAEVGEAWNSMCLFFIRGVYFDNSFPPIFGFTLVEDVINPNQGICQYMQSLSESTIDIIDAMDNK